MQFANTNWVREVPKKQEFEKFWNLEQDKAFLKLVDDENLSKERTQALIEHYIYAEKEPMRDELLDLLEGDKPTLHQRKTIGDRILKKIVDFVETFINGIALESLLCVLT